MRVEAEMIEISEEKCNKRVKDVDSQKLSNTPVACRCFETCLCCSMILQCRCVRKIIDDSKGRHFCRRACLVLRCMFCLHICSDSCYFKVISYNEHAVVLIMSSLAEEAKLVNFAKSCNKERSGLFVLKTSILLKD